MFHKVVVANRRAAAARVIRALRDLGIRSVALYSDADRDAPYLAEADEAVHIGAAPAGASYLNRDAVIAAALAVRADAVHPGYGFLAEDATFAERVEREVGRFIGPSPGWIARMGHKPSARALMAEHGIPVGGGSGPLADDEAALFSAAERVGFPLIVKPASGGGGIGMVVARHPGELAAAARRARSTVRRAFGSDSIYLERLVERPRHIELQVVADRHGAVRTLFERDCSVQRRHQKLIEEATAANLDRAVLDALASRVAAVLGGLGYDSIGTVETLFAADGSVRFIEMNTRLQVEHGVTEAITGVDLVATQIRIAAGERLDALLPATVVPDGHAIEARICAEDPDRFLPSTGVLEVFRPPSGPGIRVETGFAEGNDVTPHYDSLLAKVIAHGATRAEAIARLDQALAGFAVAGLHSNIPALRRVLASDAFRAGHTHTGLLAEIGEKQA
ncbi:acetyl-CoA carboxylase biotin carboxylase subunit [Azospirillum agricola]|uniref:acetyl-CoA carboxylase biotin carboxylase subunit n=1 Tax=Azospirillum agricola TaxID=1720247 RepID=UPI001AE9A76A|nr:biotin carboxylase N-terminal domain-containing protein [Azospirillum agricola]MBP2231863.1 acetyl-CoA carboxylase biotin carboxylase subunit [Azospirillum agricola]